MNFDILIRRQTNFVLWAPGGLRETPSLVLGTLKAGNPAEFNQIIDKPLQPAAPPNSAYLWELPCDGLGLQDGIYHYWFRIVDTSPDKLGRMLVTDPFAYTVDYRYVQNPDNHPASVIKLQDNRLVLCDPTGIEPQPLGRRPVLSLPANDQMVIYELPVSWTESDSGNDDIGTFRDVIALLRENERGQKFTKNAVVSQEAVIAELGINALELLPPIDSKVRFEWGYGESVPVCGLNP